MSTDVIPLLDIGQWREKASIIECSELFGNFPALNCMVVPCSVSQSVFSKQTNDDPAWAMQMCHKVDDIEETMF